MSDKDVACKPALPPEGRFNVPVRWRLAAASLAIFAFFTALYVARAVMLPLALAFVLSFLLTPVIRVLQRLYLPPTIGAAVVIIAFLTLIVTGVSLLSAPAAEWLERTPEAAERIEQRLDAVNQALRKFVRATERVEEFARGEEQAPLTVQGPGLRGFILSRTWQFAGGAATIIFLLYFLLASGDLFVRRMVQVLPRLRDKKIAVAIFRRIQADVTRYLFTVTLINTALGIVVAGVMSLLGMPNPVLWGVLAGILNFIPYLGPAVTLSIIAAVSLLTFDQLGDAILRPLTFLAITTLEGQLLTPYILGRRLMLNPVVIFVSLILWGWLWGIAGALLAVPLTMVIKIVCDAVPPLAPVGIFLAR